MRTRSGCGCISARESIDADPTRNTARRRESAALRRTADRDRRARAPSQYPRRGSAGVLHLRTIEDSPRDRAALDSRDACRHRRRRFYRAGTRLGRDRAQCRRHAARTRTRNHDADLLPMALGGAFRRLARRHGVDVRRNADITEITQRGSALGVVTGDDMIEVDAVLVGIGLQPTTRAGCCRPVAQPRRAASMWTPKDARHVPGIWAAGDCALYHEDIAGRRISLESWHNAEEQGAAAGRSMAGHKAPAAASKRPWFWTDQFGCNIQMLGVTSPQDGVALAGPTEAAPGAVYRTFDRTTGRLTSVVAFSDPHGHPLRAPRARRRDSIRPSGPRRASARRRARTPTQRRRSAS